MMSIFYLILALLGLGFLIFIHELGHYFMARRVGMIVEVFSIGFGPPIREWQIQGVKWQLCMLPFGGYVRIMGMDKKGNLEPHQVKDGYYGKKPIDRIKVALAGPVVNLLFAFMAFCLIWLTGGQEKPFQQYTNVIGYVDSQSKLYHSGVRPGDEIIGVNGQSVKGYQQILISLILDKKNPTLRGNEIDYSTGQKEPFSITLSTSPKTLSTDVGFIPAQYLIFEDFTSPASPLKNSQIQRGDRILWVDGEYVFSSQQLSSILNNSQSLLTVERDGQAFLAQVPRLKISDLCLTAEQRNELSDWQHEAGLKSKVTELYFIPYFLNHEGIVEKTTSFMDCNAEKVKPVSEVRRPFAKPLEPGDRIIAVNGTLVSNAIEFFSKIQDRNALIIVQRSAPPAIPTWTEADALFASSFKPEALEQIVASLGSANPQTALDNLVLLTPITLKPLSELQLDSKTKAQLITLYENKKKDIDKVENLEQRQQLLAALEKDQKKLMLGAYLQDRLVAYNPAPTTLFFEVLDQTWRTLTSLFKGILSPKSLTGPVGIVQALQSSWASGIKNAIYWLGFVSLNLAILNLLPIPVLDGGHIVFASVEGTTKRPIKAKTMEKFIFPFLVLLIILFIYLTYQDIIRLFHRLF